MKCHNQILLHGRPSPHYTVPSTQTVCLGHGLNLGSCWGGGTGGRQATPSFPRIHPRWRPASRVDFWVGGNVEAQPPAPSGLGPGELGGIG